MVIFISMLLGFPCNSFLFPGAVFSTPIGPTDTSGKLLDLRKFQEVRNMETTFYQVFVYLFKFHPSMKVTLV